MATTEINQKPLKESSGKGAASLSSTPKFERQESITPQAQPAGALDAMKGVSQSYMGLSNIGSNIAEVSSVKMAEIAGQQAGQKPGRTLIPAFTKADQAFVQSYSQMEESILGLEARKLIDRNMLDAMRNPSAGSLDAFQKNTMEGLSQIANQGSEINRAKLKQSFLDSMQSAYTRISGAAIQKDLQFQNEMNDVAFDEGLKDVQNSEMDGNKDRAETQSQQLQQQIENLYAGGQIGPKQYAAEKQALKEAQLTAREQGALMQARENGMEDDFWKEFDKRQDEYGTTPLERVSIGKGVLSLNSHLDNMENVYQTDLQLRARNESLSPGGMGPARLEYYQQEMSTTGFLQFQNFLLNQSDSKSQAIDGANYIRANGDRPDLITQNMSSTDISASAVAFWDAAEERMLANGIEEPLSLGMKIATTNDWAVPIKTLGDQIESVVKKGSDPEQAAGVMDAYLQARAANSPNVSGVDKQTEAIATSYEALRDVMPADEALARAREAAAPKNTKERIDRESNYDNEFSKNYQWNDRTTLLKGIASYLGVDHTDLPDGVGATFSALQKSYYMEGNDWDVASKNAAHKINQVSGYSDINGTSQWMMHPPEKFMKDLAGTTNWMRNQMVEDTAVVFAQLQQVMMDPVSGQGFYFEFDPGSVHAVKNPLEDSMVTNRWFRPDEATAYRVDKSGNRVQGRILMVSDNGTAHPPQGKLPSYSIWFQSDQGIEQIYDPRKFTNLRFTPDPDKYNGYVPKGENLKDYLLRKGNEKQAKLQYEQQLKRTYANFLSGQSEELGVGGL